MKILNFILQPFLYLWIAILFFFIMVPISIIALPFNQLTRFKLTAPFWYLFFNAVIRSVLFVKLYSEDRRDEMSRKTITPQGLYIANHQSFMDIPLNYSHLVIPPIMKKSILYIPVFGICAYSAGSIVVDRKDPNSRKKVFEEASGRLLTGFKQLQYYPEGTRNKKSDAPKPLEELKTKLMRYAYDHKVPVYPMSFYGTKSVMRDRIIHLGQKVGIILHAGVHPQDFKSADDFIAECWSKVVAGHQELSEKLKQG